MANTFCRLLMGLTLGFLAAVGAAQPKPNVDRPNFVVFFSDDLGYADLNCFGGESMVTPNLDRLAKNGRGMTSFYSSQAVCSASRSSLMTGCYNVRVSILGALGPGAKV
jgi:arylsulfatase A